MKKGVLMKLNYLLRRFFKREVIPLNRVLFSQRVGGGAASHPINPPMDLPLGMFDEGEVIQGRNMTWEERNLSSSQDQELSFSGNASETSRLSEAGNEKRRTLRKSRKDISE